MPKARYLDQNTLDITSFMELATFVPQYMSVCQTINRIDKNLVQAHKTIFGRQDQTCVTGSENRRFFIWRLEEMWVLVHNVRGVCLELPEGTTPDRANVLWAEYKRKVESCNGM